MDVSIFPKSFVRRQGRMTTAQKNAIATLGDARVRGLEDAESLMVQKPWGERPLVMDVGFGMGDSLLHMALSEPDHYFLGVEVYQPGIGALLQGLERESISNVTILDGDVCLWLSAMTQQSLTRCQVYFPDPWPKKRHHKRRLLQANILEKMVDVLCMGGVLHVATDWTPYAEVIMASLDLCERVQPRGEGWRVERPSWRPETKYERRGLSLGHEVWDLLAIRSNRSSSREERV